MFWKKLKSIRTRNMKLDFVVEIFLQNEKQTTKTDIKSLCCSKIENEK